MTTHADKKLLLIDPAVATPETQAVETILRAWPGRADVRRPAIDGDGPRLAQVDGAGDPYAYDAVVLLGSRASVYDDLPWLLELGKWLAPIVLGAQRLPLLGVCFGHQLVAHVGGGRVGFLREDRSKLVGFETTTFEAGRLLPPRTELPVIASHREEVKLPPPGFVVTGRRPASQHDALEHKTLPIFTVQFHPEARDEFVGRMGLSRAVYDGQLTQELVDAGDRLINAFFSLVLDQGE